MFTPTCTQEVKQLLRHASQSLLLMDVHSYMYTGSETAIEACVAVLAVNGCSLLPNAQNHQDIDANKSQSLLLMDVHSYTKNRIPNL